jgi:hypothetical protein
MTVNQPRTVPRDGLSNPSFDGMGPDEDLIVSLSFLPALTDLQLRTVYRWVRGLERAGESWEPGASPFAAGDPFVHEHLFHARLGNLPDPRATVAALVETLTAAGARVQDAFFACWERGADGVMRPRRDPRAPEGTRPSELDGDLKGGILVMDELVLEHRGAPLYFPEARIAYGLLPHERVCAGKPPEAVERALTEAITAGWATLFQAPGKHAARPKPLNEAGETDRVDRIVSGARTGYLFSIEAQSLLDRPSPGSCRFREYELS